MVVAAAAAASVTGIVVFVASMLFVPWMITDVVAVV